MSLQIWKNIVTFTDREGNITTFGPFYGVEDASEWVVGKQEQEGWEGHFAIDMLVKPIKDERKTEIVEDEPLFDDNEKHSLHTDYWDLRDRG